MNNRLPQLSLFFGLVAFLLTWAALYGAEETNLDEQAITASSSNEQDMETSVIATINQAPATSAGIPTNTTLETDMETEHTDAPLDPIERIRAIQNKTELHEALLADHKEFNRYPSHNIAFYEPEKDPVQQRYELDERITENQDDHTSLTIWSNQKYYLPGEQAKLFAKLSDAEGKPIATQFLGQVIYNERDNLQTIEFIDTNKDGIYEHTLALSPTEKTQFEAGVYKVLIVNKHNQAHDALTFILSKPNINLTGEFKDQLNTEKDLIISLEVEVNEPNRFYIQGSLYSANQVPIGAAQTSLELRKGKQWIDLSFAGNLIKDSGESGPYILKHLSLAKVTMPMQRAPMQSLSVFTQDYALSQFASSSQGENDSLRASR